MTSDGPILVVGCGLIGTSVALASVERGRQVHLTDSLRSNLELAVSRGAGTADAVDQPALVVVAVPPSVAPQVVEDALRRYPDATVTDVASVKTPVLSAVSSHPGRSRFVGGHPMAGRERSGPMAALATLFEGRPWAVVPHDASESGRVEQVVELATSVGAAARIMDPATHDRAVAFVSHVPHVASVAVAGLLHDAPYGALELAGPGLRDVTRIAGSDTAMWVDILAANADAVAELLTGLRDRLDDALAALSADPMRLVPLLDAGRAGSELIPGRHGGASENLATVFVSVLDQPGELPRLMGDTGESGTDIKDIRIDHELGRAVGQVEISIAEAGADSLVEALQARGWAAHR